MTGKQRVENRNIVFSALGCLFCCSVLFFVSQNIFSTQAQFSVEPVISSALLPAGSTPWGTTLDSEGRIWVAVPGCNPTPRCAMETPPGKISVFDPKKKVWVKTYTLPEGFTQPFFLAFDQKGRLWFPMPTNNALGMFEPSTRLFQQWKVPTIDAGPWAVAVDSKGLIWLTEHYSNKIAAFDPETEKFTEIATPALNSNPYGIVVDAADNVWFTQNNANLGLIGKYTPEGELFEYKAQAYPISGLTPHLITVDKQGNVWWTEGWVGTIGHLEVAKAQPGTNNGVTEYVYPRPCASCGTHASAIAVAPDGKIWFTDSLQNVVGVLKASEAENVQLYNATTINAYTHDGLSIDADGTVWFNETFVNKLSYVVLPKEQKVAIPMRVTPTSIVAKPTAEPTVTEQWLALPEDSTLRWLYIGAFSFLGMSMVFFVVSLCIRFLLRT